MKKLMVFLTVILVASVYITALISKPSFNSGPGCAGGGCHTEVNGIVTAQALGNLQVQITVAGVSNNKPVAGELVNSANQVVASIDKSNSNPFILTAPSEGTYTIHAGFKSPSRQFGTTTVNAVITDIRDSESAPRKIELLQNYPNPFNPTTTIKYYLHSSQHIRLVVFNLQGEIIRKLVEGYQTEGHHSAFWDGLDQSGRHVPSGIYFYRLNGEHLQITRKMVLMK